MNRLDKQCLQPPQHGKGGIKVQQNRQPDESAEAARHYDADVAIMAPFRAPGLAQASMIWSLVALADAGYELRLFDLSTVRGTSKTATFHSGILSLLNRPNVSLGLPREPYRVQSALVFRPGQCAPFESINSSIVADRTILIVDADSLTEYEEPGQLVESLDGLCRATRADAFLAAGSEETRLKLIEAGFDLLAGEWTFGAPEASIMTAREQLTNPDSIAIGRHVRDIERSWPTDEAVIRRSLPTTVEWSVRIFGPHGGIVKRLGRTPSVWTLRHISVSTDLEQLDFWTPVEELTAGSPADLSIDEAIAAGAIVILPLELKGRYGNGAVYTSPGGIRSAAKAYHANPARYKDQSRRAVEYAARNKAEKIVDYLCALGQQGPMPRDREETRVVQPRDDRAMFRILFITSNGAGMGHLTRLLGIARTMRDRAEIIFVSLSQASPVVSRFGFPFIYIASAAETGLDPRSWNLYARERFREEFSTLRPDAVVFDGTWLYNGLLGALADEAIPLIWSRRGMWKSSISDRSILNGARAIGIIEPGEFAAAYDSGQTTRVGDAHRTDPVTILSPNELLPLNDARERLGLREGEKALLVTLGAGNLNSIDSTVADVVSAMEELAPEWRLFLTSNPIAGEVKAFSNAESLDYYPVAALAMAFEATVSAAGYNSYHEWIAACVPTLWIPNLKTQTDDQVARARYAEDSGVGLCVEEPTLEKIFHAIGLLIDDAERHRMRDRLHERRLKNGASEAGDRILSLIQGAC